MTVAYKSQSYSTGKQILVFPDHYVGVAQTFLKDDAAAVTVDGRKIIKAGTIYPSNDANALGVVLSDVDVTDGDMNGTLIVHGFIKTGAIPAIPTAAAKTALKGIQFFPLKAIATTIDATGISIAANEATGAIHVIRVNISGASFRPEASNKANWTVTGESTTKVSIDSIAVADSGKYVDITTKNSAATVAGTITVVPKDAATTTGDVPASALTIVTVA